MNALGPIRADDFVSVRDEAIRLCYAAGVRTQVIGDFFGVSPMRVSQIGGTPTLRKIRRDAIQRREEAVIMRRLGELKLRMAQGK